MHERRLEPEMIRQMLDWLGRGMDAQTDALKEGAHFDMALTEEDCKFLRDFRIAIP